MWESSIVVSVVVWRWYKCLTLQRLIMIGPNDNIQDKSWWKCKKVKREKVRQHREWMSLDDSRDATLMFVFIRFTFETSEKKTWENKICITISLQCCRSAFVHSGLQWHGFISFYHWKLRKLLLDTFVYSQPVLITSVLSIFLCCGI